VRYLPLYGRYFNPIEKAFSKLKALLRKAVERTVEGLWSAIGHLLDAFTPGECGQLLRRWIRCNMIGKRFSFEA